MEDLDDHQIVWVAQGLGIPTEGLIRHEIERLIFAWPHPPEERPMKRRCPCCGGSGEVDA